MMGDRDEKILAFDGTLKSLLGNRGYSLVLAGDLDDLWFTLEKICSLLKRICDMESEVSASESRDLLDQLLFSLTEELPPIVEDIVPELRTVLNSLAKQRARATTE